MRQHHIIIKFILILAVALTGQWSFAQSDTGAERRAYGLGMPLQLCHMLTSDIDWTLHLYKPVGDNFDHRCKSH